METVRQNLCHGLRMLSKNPAFTAVAILLLATAIGANTAIFSIVEAVSLPWGQKIAAERTAAPRGNPEYITAEQLSSYLLFIASDEMEGRDTPSRGLNTLAKFIEFNLRRWGLQPAGDDGTYFQRLKLRRRKIDPARTRAEFNGRSLRYGTDFLASTAAGSASGALVFVSHGLVIKAKRIDAYQGVDVKDKILIVSNAALPEGVTPDDLKGKSGEDWDTPLTYGQAHGAKAIIQVPNFQNLVSWGRGSQSSAETGTVIVEKFQPPGSQQLSVIAVSPEVLNLLFQGEKQSGSQVFNQNAAHTPGPAFALDPNKKFNFAIGVTDEPAEARNVVATLEGNDPVLKREYVAVGAHYDHLGVGAPVDGDAIYNGADDDGSGTTAVLALAEAFARGARPKRSMLFIWHCGEEKGLWGSRYYTENPTVPLGQIITFLNIDMIGRSKRASDINPRNRELTGPHEIYVIGSKAQSTELGRLSEAVNQSFLGLSFNYKYDDPQDPHRFFMRSDHFHYAQKGIPVIFYFNGNHEDHHQPSDSADKIDYQKMEKVTRTVYATAWALGNLAKRPVVDKELPKEFTAQ